VIVKEISDITYQNIYSQRCNQMLQIKSNGGSGSMYNGIFRNFTGHANVQGLSIDAFWAQQTAAPGDGVEYYDLTFSNWAGTCTNEKPPIELLCAGMFPCSSLLIQNFNVWVETGTNQVYKCKNAYGIGACMNQFAGNGEYTSTTTVASMDPA
jgi:rhamnogalacturonan hydrolase